MKIQLIRTGGFIPITKRAEADVDHTEQEIGQLLEIIRSGPSAPRVKDGTYYRLKVGSVESTIDMEKVPGEYKALFEKLKKDLKVMK
jgi:hypothetical protein